MKNKKIRIAVYGTVLIMLAATAFVYGKLPDQIPTSWGFDGHVDYGSRNTLWHLIGLQALLAVMFDLMPRIDPRKSNYLKFIGYYDFFCLFMQIFFLAMWGIIVSESLYPGRISVARVVTILISLLFLFLGNMLPKVKSNFYVGFRTPWTLSDPEIWRRANRLGGKTMFAAGILLFISSFFLREKTLFTVMFGGLILATGIPGLMSFLWWRQKEKAAQ